MRKNMLAKLALITLAAALQLACAGAAQVLEPTDSSNQAPQGSSGTAPDAVDFGAIH